jgi:hypothetical protein
MRANPGGQLAPSETLGREALIQNLWRVLERQSVILSAERRMGKTSVVKKMVAEAPPEVLPVYRDLEGIRTPIEFTEAVFRDVDEYLGRLKRTTTRVRLLLKQLGGAEVGGVLKLPESAAPHWKTLLTNTMEDLAEHEERTVIFFWDEMPLMLYNVKRTAGEEVAMEMLDALRSVRQMRSNKIRMVFTGSIGLHNVIASLKHVGYANAPTNDMPSVDVPALPKPAAQDLARRLLEGESIPTSDVGALAASIVAAVDSIPFLIHHVVDQMAQRGGEATTDTVSEIVSACLLDPQDCWHLRHYRERISTYYGIDDRPYALSILDVLAASETPLPFDRLFNLLKSQLPTEDGETARDMLALLQRNHYLDRETDGAYRFRFPLIQRWWRLDRGL